MLAPDVRRHGAITRWIDDRGFGFVTDDENGEEAFLHVRSLSRRSIRPQVGDRVSFDVQLDGQGRPQAVRVAHARGPVFARITDDSINDASDRRARRGRPSVTMWIAVVLAVGLGFGWLLTRPSPSPPIAAAEPFAAPRPASVASTVQPRAPESAVVRAPAAPGFTCQGKSRCSQMNSCAEAVFYLRNCPGSVTDGDGDGRPCEDQWCGH